MKTVSPRSPVEALPFNRGSWIGQLAQIRLAMEPPPDGFHSKREAKLFVTEKSVAEKKRSEYSEAI